MQKIITVHEFLEDGKYLYRFDLYGYVNFIHSDKQMLALSIKNEIIKRKIECDSVKVVRSKQQTKG